MALSTIAAIAGIASAGTGIARALGGNNADAQEKFNILAQQLADARANATNAQIAGAGINQLARAGFSDSFGSGLRFDPATGQWISTLGPLPKAAQTASDMATILRNTVDVRQAQAANEQSGLQAARAQPLIDSARMRLSQFKPMTTDELSGLLGESAVNANNAVYRPLVADTLRSFARTGTAAGPVLADIGRRSAADLRQSLIDARVAGLKNVGDINTQTRQGLQSDLATAQQAGTPQFQYPQLATNNPNNLMLTLLNDRAKSAGYTSALGQNAATEAIKAASAAAPGAAGAVPNSNQGLDNLTSAAGQLKSLVTGNDFKNAFGSLFGGDNLGQKAINSVGDPASLQTLFGVGGDQLVP